MKNDFEKRLISSALAFVMVLGYVPVPTFAAETDGLCAHHTQHTEACGYSAAVEGHDCGHAHTDECYQSVTECVHTHGECGYVPAVEGQDCECQPDEHGETVHTDGCGYVEAVAEVPCGHTCSAESGCVTRELVCPHAHDGSCGYIAPTPEQPCTYACTECAEPGEDPSESEEDPSEPSEPEVDEAVEAVRALIEALPTLEEIKAMSTQEQSEVYTQVQKAYDAYDALTESQKALIPNAESTFTPLFDYFSSLTAPAATVLASGNCGSNLTYLLTSDGLLTITGSGKMDDFNGFSYTPGWYSHKDQITAVVVENGAASIGTNAFRDCSKITSVSIPGSVSSIGEFAFAYCTSLPSLSIPEGVRSIGQYAFWDCTSMSSIDLPSTAVSIDHDAFNGCSSLQSVILPEGLTTITEYMFDDCSSLVSVTIPSTVTTIERLAFSDCSSLASVTIPEKVTSIGNYAFSGCSSLSSVTIPGGVGTLNLGVFAGCTGLTSLTLSEGIATIGENAFRGCTGLSTVVFPSSLTSFSSGAFSGCTGLTTVFFKGNAVRGYNVFDTPLTAYYPRGNTTWTEGERRTYGRNVTWLETCTTGGTHTEAVDSGKEATCTETGLTEGKHCSVCMDVLVPQTEIPAVGHNLTLITGKAATCTEAGEKEHYHCSVCGKDFEDENGTTELTDTSIPAKGHSLTKVDGSEPSCTEDGVKLHYHCSVCDKDFEDANGAKEMTDTSIPTVEHEWGEWAVTTPATPEADGVETRKCTVCPQEETRPLTYTGNRLVLTGTELENQSTVWIDGVPVSIEKDDVGNSYVTLPENSSSILVTYSYNTGSGDRHTQYPTGMQVYRISEAGSRYTVERIQELDNLLQYSGSSIRITGNKGIRMITSVNQDTRNKLTGNGLAGFKLLEYGTLLAQTSKLGNNPLVLGGANVKSNYAYKKGVADPVFKYANGLIQYTNVLVGFADEQCKEDIAMRPYMKLEDENGEEFVIYGGIVYRSIGYIAWQNKDVFSPGTAAYNYVWDIIHAVYGDDYNG